MRTISFCFVLLFFLSCSETKYQEVSIGDKIIMDSNLNTSSFQNGDPIKEARTNAEWRSALESEEPAWCYYDNNPNNGKRYGKLYNWYAINDPRDLAPKGWHIPDQLEWNRFIYSIGGPKALYYAGDSTGYKMKSSEGWSDGSNGNNSFGFNGLPGGFRKSDGEFYGLNNNGIWWSRYDGDYKGRAKYASSFRDYDQLMLTYGTEVFVRGGDVLNGYSVRCIRDYFK